MIDIEIEFNGLGAVDLDFFLAAVLLHLHPDSEFDMKEEEHLVEFQEKYESVVAGDFE